MPRGWFHWFHFAKVCPSPPGIATAQTKLGINQVRNRSELRSPRRRFQNGPLIQLYQKFPTQGFAVEPRVCSKDSRRKRPPNPEAQKVAPAAEGIPEAAGGPEVQWTADP